MSEIRVIAENRPAKSRHAVVLCCDKKYLPYAALTIHTLLRNTPVRDFDVCITSLDALDMPPALEGHDIRMCRIDVGDAFEGMPVTDRLSVATYMRLALPEAFASDYDRILYIDSDVFIVGTALSDVFTLDLGGRVLGACLDTTKWKHPTRQTRDQAAVGITGSYFNAGVLLIDCVAFCAQDIRLRCIATAQKHAGSVFELDQTLLNIMLQDAWAMLHPAWNWQWVVVRPLFEAYVDTQIVHFIGTAKPWSAKGAKVPVRYREIARRFMEANYPELAMDIARPKPRFEGLDLAATFLRHMTRTRQFAGAYNRHGGDILCVLAPPDLR
ncbi:glycosyltransferase family 8 protein [Yoonia vestfoldensis]|uniref:glycosyltransferase family 8 protein n=1 Tax=Yoonia vestfoldensis TaxID=245188 RepID=UPI00036D3025|nr:glycosyltransferase family 8 protein [Yoonia vestfoldensis]